MPMCRLCEGEGVFVLKPFSSLFKSMHNLLSQFSLFCVWWGWGRGGGMCVCQPFMSCGFFVLILFHEQFLHYLGACVRACVRVCVCVRERERVGACMGARARGRW